MVLGSLILQLRMGFTDRDLVDQIQQNPYYQYFIGLSAFQHEVPFARTLLVEWRKRIDLDFIIRANDILCNSSPKTFGFRKAAIRLRKGTLLATQICDATVAPQYIRYPQDASLLNEARCKLEAMIDYFCTTYGLDRPRTYRKVAHRDYLSFARSKRPSSPMMDAWNGQKKGRTQGLSFFCPFQASIIGEDTGSCGCTAWLRPQRHRLY